MARSFYIEGQMMVSVKGNVNTPMSSLTQLGLTDSPIQVTPNFHHDDVVVDAFGSKGGMVVPPDIQVFLTDVNISMTVVHFDRAILEACLAEAMGGINNPNTAGYLNSAGLLLGNGQARFAANNHFIGLNLIPGTGGNVGQTWRFLYSYLTGPPMIFPLGTERSAVQLNWRAVPFQPDPWNGGAGAQGAQLWDYLQDQ